MVKLANPNWPLGGFEVDFTSGPPNTPGSSRKSIEAKYRRLAIPQFSIDRGRQYELDQVQSGVFTALMKDPLELFNADNVSSPFNAGLNAITPYRAMWNWWIWPNQPGSGNINSTTVNTAYDPSFELNPFSALGNWAAAGGTTTLAQSGVQHFDGIKALLVTQSAAGAGFGVQNVFRTSPDITYTFSAYVFPTGGCSVTMRVVDANGTTWTSATAATQNTWQRLSITWDTVDTLEPITIYGTGVTTPTFYVDAVQLEFGANASTFTTTGPKLYMLWTGYVERFPVSYDMSGLRALHNLSGVDALAILSRTAVAQTYTATITTDGPVAYAPLSNAKPPTSSGTLSSGTETGTITGAVMTGNPIARASATGSINWAGDTQPDSTPAVVLQQGNANNPPKAGHAVGTYPNEQQTVFDVLPAGVGSVNNASATIEIWAKFSSGVVIPMQLISTAVHGGGLNIELGYGSSTTQNVVQIITLGGQLFFEIYDPAGGLAATYDVSNATISGAGFPDGQWHYFAITFYAGSNIALTYDNVEFDYVGPTGARNYGFSNFHAEATSDYGDIQSQMSIARFAVYNTDIGSTARNKHYQRGIGYKGEISGARATRLLNQYWAGASSVAAGYLAMAADHGYNTRVLLDVLQEIQESERGLTYADRNGTVVFEDRTSRYTAGQTSIWVFGENPVGASPTEYPYEDYAVDVDPTYTFSQSNLTRPDNSNFAPVVNATTQAKYGQRVLSQEVQCNYDFDLTQAAVFYNNRYANPVPRVSKLTLNPAANPALWPVVLSLEISQRVTVKRRNAGLTVSREYYIEKISHQVDADAGKWTVDLQMSPVFVPQAWVLENATYGVLGTTTTPVY